MDTRYSLPCILFLKKVLDKIQEKLYNLIKLVFYTKLEGVSIMSSVKDSFSKGIGYIKRDLNILLTMRDEIKEFLHYYNELPDLPKYRLRIAKEQERLTKIREGIFEVSNELSFYKEYFRYSQAEIDAIPPATEESIERDLHMQEQELKKNTWTEEDTRRVFEKAGIYLP